jgi:Uma2 family endonuclease
VPPLPAWLLDNSFERVGLSCRFASVAHERLALGSGGGRMTAWRQQARPLTIDDYIALGEDDSYRSELQEGCLVMEPSPAPFHMIASGELYGQLRAQLPAGLCAVPDVDIDLELAPPDQPGSSRRPDLVVVHRAAVDRVEREGGMLRASETVLVVEIVSPSSRRRDNLIKRGEYADAGIPHYWIVDLDRPVSLIACHLAVGFGYQDSGGVRGVFTATEPFPVRLDLDNLR